MDPGVCVFVCVRVYDYVCVFFVYASLCVCVFVIYLSMEKLYFVVKYFDFCGLSTPTKVL